VFRDALGHALVRAQVPVDFGGASHMTLAYGGDDVSEPLAEPVHWVAHEVVLVHSLVGQGRHLQLGRWPLLSRR
jgi:2'-5' RNA ligase